MSNTLWFTTKSNAVLRHALTADDRAACNKRIRPHLFPVRNPEGVPTHCDHNGAPANELPNYAQLCPRCLAAVSITEEANQDKFSDWDGRAHELELVDQGDSISVAFRLSGDVATLEFDVRIDPADLDRLERRIREIRQERGT